MTRKVALVTGASSGIGASTAIALAEAGFLVYAGARRVERMESLRAHGIRPIHLDITDESSIDACLAHIRADGNDVDVLVNNAGYGSYGALEEVPMSEAQLQFDVNIFGLAAVTQKVISNMRRKRWGRIINVSSIGGVLSMPFGGWYHASKFALEGYSAALRQELEPFGVDVSVIRPGGTKSEWAGIATQSLTEISGTGPYAKAVQALALRLRNTETQASMQVEPEVIAKLIVEAATAKRRRTVYVPRGHARVFLCLRRMLSDRLYDALIRMAAGLPKRMGDDSSAAHHV